MSVSLISSTPQYVNIKLLNELLQWLMGLVMREVNSI